MKIIEIVSKVKVENKKLLALVYTPGVARVQLPYTKIMTRFLTLQTGQIPLRYYLLIILKA